MTITDSCAVPTCDRPRYSKGYCASHKARLDRTGDVRADVPLGAPRIRSTKICVVEGCNDQARSKSMCAFHYDREFRLGIRVNGESPICSVDECDKPVRSRSLCNAHYARFIKYGSTDLPDRQVQPRRKRKTNKITHPSGYVYVKAEGHPNARPNGWILEHRFIMSEVLQRPLRGEENVHHINGDRADNRPENLELWTRSQPPGQRVDDKIKWAEWFLSIYKPDALAPAKLAS